MKFKNTPSCAGIDTELFFPQKGRVIEETRMVKKICAKCLAFEECFTFSMLHAVDGIWAGTTPKERQRYRRINKIEAQPIYLPENLGLPREERNSG